MSDSIAKSDQQLKAIDIVVGSGVETPESGDELQSHAPEVVLQCVSPRVPVVELAALPQQSLKSPDLPWIRLEQVYARGFVVKLPAIHLNWPTRATNRLRFNWSVPQRRPLRIPPAAVWIRSNWSRRATHSVSHTSLAPDISAAVNRWPAAWAR